MKPNEILGALPQWSGASADAILSSEAWAMPCRLGDAACVMRLDALRPADTLDIAIMLADERHVLSLVDTPRFEDLHRIWASRADVPEPILLALVEKECGPLLQLIENAARRQLKIAGLATEGPDSVPDAASDLLCAQIHMDGEPALSFAITSSPSLVEALGRLVFIDTAHPSIRGLEVSAVTEFASFALPASDMASISVGDALLLPEIGTVPPRFVVEGVFLVDENGVSQYEDDGRLRVQDVETHAVTLGWLLDHAQSPSAPEATAPSQLRLVASGKAIATGHLGPLAGQTSFVVESLG